MIRIGTLYLVLFSVLVIINLYLAALGIFQYQKKSQAQRILSEINHVPNLNSQFSFSSAPFVLGSLDIASELSDGRAINLRSFIRKYYPSSPLYDYVDYIVKVSDKYQFDYRLLIAIAMQESNLCRRIPNDSHNCWGWGIYGDKVKKFSSYQDGIETVASGIKKNYIDKGLVTPSTIMAKYTPASNGSWAKGVTTFFRMLE